MCIKPPEKNEVAENPIAVAVNVLYTVNILIVLAIVLCCIILSLLLAEP